MDGYRTLALLAHDDATLGRSNGTQGVLMDVR
jgi:hypothetical protein